MLQTDERFKCAPSHDMSPPPQHATIQSDEVLPYRTRQHFLRLSRSTAWRPQEALRQGMTKHGVTTGKIRTWTNEWNNSSPKQDVIPFP